ncbi:hypothetical protein ACN38_g12415 [Penicillium nordicum]|uniref:Uncharacterized protein n=1 Tax=Penicillium nordicum TaxID=229535 RepID=A0A0M8NPM8_9EURO|nr:hypothetical protein ACN38_g12415 [Penicillium nordicum]
MDLRGKLVVQVWPSVEDEGKDRKRYSKFLVRINFKEDHPVSLFFPFQIGNGIRLEKTGFELQVGCFSSVLIFFFSFLFFFFFFFDLSWNIQIPTTSSRNIPILLEPSPYW